VVVLDDLSAGRLDNLALLNPRGRLKLVKGDVRDATTVRKALKDVDTVFHLAALVSVQAGVKDPKRMRDINSNGTKTLLEGSAACSVDRFVFASSAAVYGALSPPLRESRAPSPISAYGQSKLEGEAHCRRFFEKLGVGTVSLRYFNAYGPRSREGAESGVITRFARRLTNGERPVIYGNGLQTRDFVEVRDIVEASIRAATHPRSPGKTYNVGTGRPTTILGLLRLEAELLGIRKQLRTLRKPARKADIQKSCADIGLIRKELGYSPSVSLREGLAGYLKWLQRD